VTAEADLDRVRGLVGAALASLETSRGRIDDLNVYPVPDGDTGTNLTLTVRAVADAVSSAQPADRPALARAVARAALMGARGNSGVILSQIVRGVADVLAESTNGIGPALTARALRGASDAAYRAVRRPVEGTMLTVIRELAEEAERHSAESGPTGKLLVDLVRHGEEAVARTPEQLEILREAGVVDAGGAGLVELLRGLAGAVTGEAMPAAPAVEAPTGIEAMTTTVCNSRAGSASARAMRNTASGAMASFNMAIAVLCRQPGRIPYSARPMPSTMSERGIAAWLTSCTVSSTMRGSVRPVKPNAVPARMPATTGLATTESAVRANPRTDISRWRAHSTETVTSVHSNSELKTMTSDAEGIDASPSVTLTSGTPSNTMLAKMPPTANTDCDAPSRWKNVAAISRPNRNTTRHPPK